MTVRMLVMRVKLTMIAITITIVEAAIEATLGAMELATLITMMARAIVIDMILLKNATQ